MVMKDLCEKIKWEQTRTLETGQVVTTGCEGNIETHSHLFLFLANSLAQVLYTVYSIHYSKLYLS